ncbi:zinc-binding dehydrogenase [Pyrobaculum aerophilum]|uniref:zinc-binding dehydrogenase n=1 Tax=Pyrobaculum aerophilum TaxID=13773 RepID=UPI0028683B36|nr:zinc-binding dehydrogenase [Pyrobaculum aerophilum]
MQFAKLLGGEVYAISRRKAKVESILKSAGADAVLTPDEAKSAAPFDVVLDPTGSASWDLSFGVLGRGGRYVTAGADGSRGEAGLEEALRDADIGDRSHRRPQSRFQYSGEIAGGGED